MKKNHDCNKCQNRVCQGDFLIVKGRRDMSWRDDFKLKSMPCPGMRTNEKFFMSPLIEKALEHPQSLHDVLSSLPFKTFAIQDLKI